MEIETTLSSSKKNKDLAQKTVYSILFSISFAHLLNALGVASGLARPEQDSANCAKNCRKSGKPKGIWGKELPDKGNQRSPR